MPTHLARNAIQYDRPVFLTSGICEATEHFTVAELRICGLATADDYPLTAEESALVADEVLTIAEHIEVSMGYTALWRGYKWFVPEIDIYFQCAANPELTISPSDAWQLATAMANALEERLRALGVEVRLIPDDENDEPDRYTIRPLFPASLIVHQFPRYDIWRGWIRTICLRAMQEATPGVPGVAPDIPLPGLLFPPDGTQGRIYRVIMEQSDIVADDPVAAVRAAHAVICEPNASRIASCVVTPTGELLMVRLDDSVLGGYDCWTATREELLARGIDLV